VKEEKLRIDKDVRDDLIRMVFDDEGIPLGPLKNGGPHGYIDLDNGDYIFIDVNGGVLRKSKSVVRDLCRANGIEPPNIFSGIRIMYDPMSEPGIHWRPDVPLFNTYRPSRFQNKIVAMSQGPFPVISNLLKNIFVDTVARYTFLNWLAVIFNEGQKTGTAWVIMGPQGSGKNTLYSRILVPLIGGSNCRLLNQDTLESRFNKLMADRQLVCFNEVKATTKAQDRLKTWITEDEFVMEDKRASSAIMANPVNLIFLSNNRVPVLIEPDDRRFSVVKTGPPLKNLSWFKGRATLDAIYVELGHFAWFLKHYDYDVEASHTPLSNDTKQILIEKSMDSFQEFGKRLKANDTAWFLSQIDSSRYSKSELSDLSGFKGRLQKELAVKVFGDIYPESVTTNSLTRKLKDQGVGESRGKLKNDTRKREYTWSS